MSEIVQGMVNVIPAEFRFGVGVTVAACAGAAVGNAIYYHTGINGDRAEVAANLNLQIDQATQSAAKEQAELATLQDADKVYAANDKDIPDERTRFEHQLANSASQDKTMASTLAKQVPHITYPCGDLVMGGAGLGVAAALIGVHFIKRRALANAQPNRHNAPSAEN